MPRIEFDMETAVAPETVVSMLTVFSTQRPEVWPGLWQGVYEVYSVGETTAEIREGNRSPRVWARERYDWSVPGTVRWTVVESNFSTPGSYVEAKVSPRQGGGSRVHVTWERTPSSGFARFIFLIIKLTRGAPVRSSLAAGFKKAERGFGS